MAFNIRDQMQQAKIAIEILCATKLSAICLLLFAALSTAADWPHSRGKARNGSTPESSGSIDGKWDLGTPLWNAEVGEGCTSPLIIGDNLYVMGHSMDHNRVVCLDTTTGKERWTVSYAAKRFGRYATGDQGMYGGPSSTPEFDPATGYLYTLGPDGDLLCLNTKDSGTKKWAINLYDVFKVGQRPKVGVGGVQRDYGYTSSPLVLGDWLLVEVGAKGGNLIALDKMSGKQVWASANKDLAGHTGGMALMTVEGIPCVAVLTLYNLVVTRLDKGNEGTTVGIYSWATEFGNNIASPAIAGECVLITSAYNKNAMCKVLVTLKGLERVWEAPVPSKACTPVVYKGHIYVAWQKISCLDLANGKKLWDGGQVGDPGSIIATADDRLIVWGQNGRLALVETAERSPNQYTEIARLDRIFTTHAWPPVAISGGKLVLKDRSGKIKVFALPNGK